MSVNQVSGVVGQPLHALYANVVNAQAGLTPVQREKLLWRLQGGGFSKLNENVKLDERNWAVTLVSKSGANVDYGSGSEMSDGGHAMIACEGMINGRQFIKYAHITPNQDRSEQARPIPDGEARQEVISMDHPMNNTHYGPTWSRPRYAVELMLNPIEAAEAVHRHVRFERYNEIIPATTGVTVSAAIGYFWNPWYGLFLLLSDIVPKWTASSYTSRGYYSCRSWAVANMERAGIRIELSRVVFTPNDLVEHLRSHPQEVRLD